MSRVWEENTVRYEITLFGFEAIHTFEYHKILNELEQFFIQQDKYYEKHQECVEIFNTTVKDIGKGLLNCLYTDEIETPPEIIIQHTEKWFETETDNSGNSKLVKNNKTKDPTKAKPPPEIITA